MNRLNIFNQRFAAGRATRGGSIGGSGFDPITETFSLLLNDSGPSLVPTSLTIEGTPVAASLFYRGELANPLTWVSNAGPALNITGGGSDPIFEDSPYLDLSESPNFQTAKHYQSSYSQDVNDFVFLASLNYRYPGTPTVECGTKATAGATEPGWLLYGNNATSVRFYISNGTTQTFLTIPITESNNIICVCVDRDGPTAASSARAYVNGQLVLSLDVSGITGSLNSGFFRIGGGPSTNKSDSTIHNVAFWQGSNLFSGALSNAEEMDRIAQELTSKLVGVYPTEALGDPMPAVATRSSISYCPIVNSDGFVKYHQVGNHWLRTGSMLEEDGVSVAKGYLPEQSRTQTAVNTDDLTAAAWVTNLASVSLAAAGIQGPVINEPVHTLSIEDGNGEHTLLQGGFAVSAGVSSLFVKQHPSATLDEFILSITGTNNRRVTIDFTTGIATPSGADDGGAVAMGDGWYWIWLRRSAGNETFKMLLGLAGSFDHTTGSNPEVYIQAPQRESTNDIPSTYIRNSAASGVATRQQDVLSFQGSPGNFNETEFSLDATIWRPKHIAVGTKYVWGLSDNGSSSDRTVLILSSNNFYGAFTASTEAGSSGVVNTSVNITDGYSQSSRLTLTGSNYTIYDVKNAVSNSYSITPPNDLNRISVGIVHTNSGLQLCGLISDFRMINKAEAPA